MNTFFLKLCVPVQLAFILVHSNIRGPWWGPGESQGKQEFKGYGEEGKPKERRGRVREKEKQNTQGRERVPLQSSDIRVLKMRERSIKSILRHVKWGKF